MKQFLFVIVLGAALFMGGAWQLGLLDSMLTPSATTLAVADAQGKVTPLEQLGGDLFPAAKPVDVPPSRRSPVDSIVLHGTMNPIEQEEVASQVNGKILFIGDQVDESAVLAAGSAPFVAEPYYFADVYAGRESFVKFYRRIYEGETVVRGQMVAMIEPGEALGMVLKEIGRIKKMTTDWVAAEASEKEAKIREQRAYKLMKGGNISPEEYGSAEVTWIKLKNERISKFEDIHLAQIDKDLADIKLNTYAIRATLPYKHSTVKTIVRQRGFVVKQGDPVLLVQNLERLQAEALVEEQYYTHLKKARNVMATIEPTVLDKPIRQYPGHALDVTSIAVAKDMRIVSGSEDRSVCVWSQEHIAPVRKLEHDDAVRVLACTPVACEKNLCLVGCSNGSIYLWDLAGEDAKPLKLIEKAHGPDAGITSVAFSPDGTYFASGASDGSIRVWATWMKKKEKADVAEAFDYAVERYPFSPEHGVAQGHEDAVTSLAFTPQCQLVSASRDKTLRVWLLKEKGAALDRRVIRDRVGNVPNLGVARNGKWMLFDQGRMLKLFSLKSQTFTDTLSMPPSSTPFDTLALFSPDNSLILTAGAPEGRLQLWRTPDDASRGYEVRQFATLERLPVTCAAFSPDAGKGGAASFAVSASGSKIYQWSIPTKQEVESHPLRKVRMTLIHDSLDASRQGRVAFEISNAEGRFEAGRPVTIVIE